MSQPPRHVPSHSPLPSTKSSRRTPGGGGTSAQPPATSTTTAAAPRSLLPSPHFEDDPIVASHQHPTKRPSLTLNDPEYSEHAVAESEHYSSHSYHGQASTQQAHTGDNAAIPSFQPFFTLIEDSVTNEHYHPTVHYIFADDDADIITEAALRSLEVLDPSQRGGGGVSQYGQGQGQGQVQPRAPPTSRGNTANPSRLPPPTAGTREHYIILDIHPSLPTPALLLHQEDTTTSSSLAPATSATAPTYSISTSHSLSAEWQVLRTSISTAPTIGDNPPTAEDEGLMLRIEGRGNTPAAGEGVGGMEKGKGREIEDKDREGGRERESMEEMIERFQRRLEDVRMVVDVGGVPGQRGGEGGGEVI